MLDPHFVPPTLLPQGSLRSFDASNTAAVAAVAAMRKPRETATDDNKSDEEADVKEGEIFF